jgi:hypothetical protein
LEAAKMLGKTVFDNNKLLVYDLQENLILELPLRVGLKIIIDAENTNVTISSPEIEEMESEVGTSVEDILW